MFISITYIIITTLNWTFLPTSQDGFSFFSSEAILLRKGQDICRIPLNDLDHST